MAVRKCIRDLPIRFGGEPHSGWLPPGAALPLPTPVEDVLLNLQISDTAQGFILEWWDEGRRHVGDTWHQSVEEALVQAEHWFGITSERWKDGSS